MIKFINQMEPWIGEEEKGAIVNYLDSGGWLTEFKKTREFESMIAEYTGVKYCSVLMNGTVTLFTALMALGVGVGDEVICPDYTMVASANSICMTGARVVFADIEKETLCLDFNEMKSKLTPKTKAIVLVTINGRCPTRYEEIINFCREKEIKVIEDAAQSLGSFHNCKHLGTFGDIGSLSFSAPKIITTGQGGALITDDKELYSKITKIKDFGRSQGGIDFYQTMGFNFKFTDLQAVIGIEQMKKLPWRVNRKKEIYKMYVKCLKGFKGLKFISTDLINVSPWFVDVLSKDRDGLKKHLKANNIGSREFYPSLHNQPVYGENGDYPIAEMISKKGLWLPSSAFLSDEQIYFICDVIKKFI